MDSMEYIHVGKIFTIAGTAKDGYALYKHPADGYGTAECHKATPFLSPTVLGAYRLASRLDRDAEAG